MKSVLITGGTKGIGRACVDLFHREGWSVTAVARTAVDLDKLATQLPNVLPVCADLSTKAGTELVPTGPYDVLIFNAGAYRPGNLLKGEDVFDDLLPLNILGHHRLGRRLLPPMMENGEGHLIVIGSAGTDHWKESMTAYVATKYALRGLFLGWQKELAPTGIRCSLIAPGATLTSSWDNEIPPPDILRPDEVAKVIFQALREDRTGRHVVRG